MYGIEEKNFMLNNGRIDLTGIQNSIYGWSGAKPFMDIDLNRPLVNEPSDYNEIIKKLASMSLFPPDFGFSINIDSFSKDVLDKIENMGK